MRKGAASFFFAPLYSVHPQLSSRRILMVAVAVACLIPGLSLAQQHESTQAAATTGPHVPAALNPNPHHAITYGRLPISFEPNQGQAGPRVKFLARGPGYTLFLKGTEAEFSLQGTPKARPQNKNEKSRPATARKSAHAPTLLSVKLQSANPNAPVAGVDKLPGVSNYYIGNDPKKWHTGIPTYARVKYQSVYPGIDLVYYGNKQQLEYDFVVAPGADTSRIRMNFSTGSGKNQSGQSTEQPVAPRIDSHGNLVIKTAAGKLRFHAPMVYQPASGTPGGPSQGGKRNYVKGRFVTEPGNAIGFEISTYDHTRPLIIDPVLTYASYFDLSGGNGGTIAGIGVDGSGDAYVLETANLSPAQVAVRALNPQGNWVLYTTFLGGSGGSAAGSIAVDSAGDAYIDGTAGAGFPTTTGAFQSTCNSTSCNAPFAAKLSPSGSLQYATYLGPSMGEVRSIAIDASGDAYIAGMVNSTDLPLVNAFQTQYASFFLQKLDPTGSQLLYSSYFGSSTVTPGTASPSLAGIAVDGSGNMYVAGDGSVPFKNPLEQGVGSMFLAKFTPDGSSLVYSTQLGGSGGMFFGGLQFDGATGLAVDSSGDAYVTGTAFSPDFPVTMNAYKASCLEAAVEACQNPQVFVMKVDPNGTSLLYSTLIGSGRGGGIAVDSTGNAWVTGKTSSNYFPVIQPIESNLQQDIYSVSHADAYLTRLKADGTPDFSTYLGGSFTDEAGVAVAVDQAGDAYIDGTFRPKVNDVPADFPMVNPSQGYQKTATFFIPATLFVAKVSPSVPGPAISLSPWYVSILNLRNVSSSPLGVNSITPSSTLTLEGKTCGSSIPAGGTCTLILYPQDPTAYLAGTLTVSSNAAGSPQQFTIHGSQIAGTIQVLVSPNYLEFPAQLAGTPGTTHTITLTNLYYPNPLTISYIGIPQADPSNGTSGDFTETNNCPASLPAGSSCTINVQFLPTSGADGVKGSYVEILLQNPPYNYYCYLHGIRRSESLAASAQSVEFGFQEVGATPLARVVTLTNTDVQSVSVSGISVSGPFTQTNNCTASLAPHTSCRVAVSFVPTNNGSFTGQLTANFSGQGSPATVNLAGTAKVPADIDVSPYSLTFRSIVGSSGTQSVTLKNVSTSTVTLSAFDLTPSEFTQTNDCNGSLSPAATCTVTVTFTPTATGTVDGSLTISFSGQGSPQIIPLTGIATTPLQTTPTALEFGEQAVGSTSATQNVSLSNQSTTNVTINSINVSGDFQLVSNLCPNPITPFYSCFLQVAFAPTTLGTLTGSLTIDASDTSTPHTVALSGTGANVPEVSFSPASLTFSALEPGSTSAPQTITLKNAGSATLTVSNLEAVGDFAQTNTCGTSVAAGATCSINVTFSPTSGGQRTGSIVLVDNAPDSPQTVSLTGTGSDFSMATASGTSRAVMAGSSAGYMLMLSSEGGFNQTVSLACTGAPSKATCTVTPASVTLNGTNPQSVDVNITTTAASLAPPGPMGGPPPPGGFSMHLWWMTLLWLLTMSALAVAFHQQRRRVPLLAGAVLLAALAVSCGGGGSSSGGGGNAVTNPGTPKGTYTLTVTGTSGSLQHQVDLQLTVL